MLGRLGKFVDEPESLKVFGTEGLLGIMDDMNEKLELVQKSGLLGASQNGMSTVSGMQS